MILIIRCWIQPAVTWLTDCHIQYFVFEQYIGSKPVVWYIYLWCFVHWLFTVSDPGSGLEWIRKLNDWSMNHIYHIHRIQSACRWFASARGMVRTRPRDKGYGKCAWCVTALVNIPNELVVQLLVSIDSMTSTTALFNLVAPVQLFLSMDWMTS